MSDADMWVTVRYEGGSRDGLVTSLPAPCAVEGNDVALPSPGRLLNDPPEAGKIIGPEYYGDRYVLERRDDEWIAVYKGGRQG